MNNFTPDLFRANSISSNKMSGVPEKFQLSGKCTECWAHAIESVPCQKSAESLNSLCDWWPLINTVVLFSTSDS